MRTGLEEADVAFDQQITELAKWESQHKLSRSSWLLPALPVKPAQGQQPGGEAG